MENRNWRPVLQTARATLTLNFRPAHSSRIYGELGALLVTTRGEEQYAISSPKYRIAFMSPF